MGLQFNIYFLVYKTLNLIIENKKDSVYQNFIWMGLLVVGYRILAFLVLLLKSRRK